MDKHAYLILAHKNAGQLKELVGLLDDKRNEIFIHLDAKAGFGYEIFRGVCKESPVFFIEPRISVHWGGISIMRAELELLKAALERGCAYCHLLSGMDLPIKSQDEIHAFFDAHKGYEFLQLWQFKPHTHRRFHYRTLFPEGAGQFWANIANVCWKGIQMALGLKINKDIEFKFASQWFSISGECAAYVVSKEEWLEKVFAHTNTADEIFLATAIWNSPFRERIFDKTEHIQNTETDSVSSLRFIDWTRGKSVRHPWTFTNDDYDLLMSVPHFWARKFDENVDSEIIERISRKLKPHC